MISRIKNKLIWEGVIRAKYNKGKKCVVMYHGIDQDENTRYNARFFSASSFEKQIKYFAAHYNIVPLQSIFTNEGLSKDKLNLAITFDDGYRNNLKYALPILEKNKAFATFFITGLNSIHEDITWFDLVDICTPYLKGSIEFNNKTFTPIKGKRFDTLKKHIKETGIVGTPLFKELKTELLKKSGIELNSPDIVDYWQLLSDAEIQEVAKAKYVQVGAHGISHNNLGSMPLSSAIEELKASKLYLENLTQYEVNTIGYPDGSYTPELAEKAFIMGYTYQCAVNYHNTTDSNISYLINRLGLYPPASIPYLDYEIQKFSIA